MKLGIKPILVFDSELFNKNLSQNAKDIKYRRIEGKKKLKNKEQDHKWIVTKEHISKILD